jgi:hypothetical protein
MGAGAGIPGRRRPERRHPAFITTTNARELYDLRPGETVARGNRRAQGVKEG